MELVKIRYAEYQGQDREWSLENLELGRVNLLVGKNATGKTRVLNVISNLGGLLSSLRRPVGLAGSYDVEFDESGSRYNYSFQSDGVAVVKERLDVGSQLLLDRGPGARE